MGIGSYDDRYYHDDGNNYECSIMNGVQVVWFKRDLRIEDHKPLVEAARRGPVLPLYIFEPELWRQPDLSERHFAFLIESLESLERALDTLGQPLVYRTGDVVEILSGIHHTYKIERIWSHQETWNGWTYTRDKAVKRWCTHHGISWNEPLQYGVVRHLTSRDGWAGKWQHLMRKRLLNPPTHLETLKIDPGNKPTARQLGIAPDPCLERQRGGREHGLALLDSFLRERGEPYQKGMSSPVTAASACSRLSPHLAFGTLSMREVYQKTLSRMNELRLIPVQGRGQWLKSLNAFTSRLQWHCHFMQKLEDEPDIEFKNLHSAYDGLRETSFNKTFFEAWKVGETGFPMVDACMRSLIETGWINFRMRAMLMSFASYHLWLHWRQTGLHLARLFTDYEPGIHYSQCQMQSGTTGINTPRVYNPTKQGLDHDPDAQFIKRWIPELRDVTAVTIHTPQLLHAISLNYPDPIVHEQTARKTAASRIYSLRRDEIHRVEAQKIIEKHGSRKTTISKAKAKKNSKPSQITANSQIEIPFHHSL